MSDDEGDDEHKCKCNGDGRCLADQEKFHCRWRCMPRPCPNHEVCGKTGPSWYFRRYHGLCGSCYELFGCRLTIRREDAECPVCYETVNALVEFPTDCGHFFCGHCSHELLFYDETRFYLSPVRFGGPECPNGCQNPDVGRQCQCVEHDEDIELWRVTSNSQWTRWVLAEDQSIEDAGTNGVAYGSKKCPLCRKEFGS